MPTIPQTMVTPPNIISALLCKKTMISNRIDYKLSLSTFSDSLVSKAFTMKVMQVEGKKEFKALVSAIIAFILGVIATSNLELTIL